MRLSAGLDWIVARFFIANRTPWRYLFSLLQVVRAKSLRGGVAALHYAVTVWSCFAVLHLVSS